MRREGKLCLISQGFENLGLILASLGTTWNFIKILCFILIIINIFLCVASLKKGYVIIHINNPKREKYTPLIIFFILLLCMLFSNLRITINPYFMLMLLSFSVNGHIKCIIKEKQTW